MTYTPEELNRMKRNLGITDEDLVEKLEDELSPKPSKNKKLRVDVHTYDNDYWGKSKGNRPIVTSDLARFAEKCYDKFIDEKNIVKFIRYRPGKSATHLDRKFTDDEWRRFYGMLKDFCANEYRVSKAKVHKKGSRFTMDCYEVKKIK
jgi:hypothetical protein